MQIYLIYNVFLFVFFFLSFFQYVLAGSELAHGAERYVLYQFQKVNIEDGV
jgi:hypothetical protein